MLLHEFKASVFPYIIITIACLASFLLILLSVLLVGVLAMLSFNLLNDFWTDAVNSGLVFLEDFHYGLTHFVALFHHFVVSETKVIPSIFVADILEEVIDLEDVLDDILESLHYHMELVVDFHELVLPNDAIGRILKRLGLPLDVGLGDRLPILWLLSLEHLLWCSLEYLLLLPLKHLLALEHLPLKWLALEHLVVNMLRH
jgi:hypothetical protein